VTKDPSDDSAAALVEPMVEVPRGELLRLSFLIRDLAKTRDDLRGGASSPDRTELVAIAADALRVRHQRSIFFAKAMFGEPAWDILLVLYVAEGIGEPRTVNQASELAGVAPTSAKRWIEYLEQNQLVTRRTHDTDSRRILLELTPRGRTGLDGFFRTLAGTGWQA